MTDALLGGAMMVAYVISPGPVNVETLRRGAFGRRSTSNWVRCWAMDCMHCWPGSASRW